MDIRIKLDNLLKKFSNYFYSFRPWSFSSSLTPCILGTIIAVKISGQFSYLILLVTCITVIALHGAGNLVNTYFDFLKGVDSFKSDDRTLVDKKLTPAQVISLGMYSYIVACIGLLIIIYLSPSKSTYHPVHLAIVFFWGLTGSFIYTGGFGLKYIALGDLLVLSIFANMVPIFAYMGQTGTTDLITLKYAIPLALNTEAILHSNNTRDMENDKRAGLITIPILLGPTFSYILYAFLLFAPFIMFILFSLHYSAWFLLPLITLPRAFKIERNFRSKKLDNVPSATAKLNIYLALFYLASLIMTPNSKLPFLITQNGL